MNRSGEKTLENSSANPLSHMIQQHTVRGANKEMSHYMIFGKEDCPHTRKARDDFKKMNRAFIYVNVDTNPHGLEKLLEYTDGKYIVPVIVEVDEGNVEIGYTGD